ncbi:hypothetical protein [Patulibacter defluvii]|uniref:hypothetical protein n=1 Tax=Patulibacter defluvii TaxID=3095358 RepID=UPI002A7553EF|nr:hypothetical protein [Patulibacter sp. DM4]
MLASGAAAAPLGQLDGAFAVGSPTGAGIARFDDNTRIEAVAVGADGKAVVVGSSGAPGSSQLFVARLNRDGSRDGSFAAEIPAPNQAVADATSLEGTGVALFANGKVVVSATARASGLADGMVAVKFNADGKRDGSFDGDGVQAVKGGFNGQGEANDVAVAPGGGIVLGGSSVNDQTDPNPAATVARLTPAGAPDGGLGGGVRVAAGPSRINALRVQADGRIVAVGAQQVGQPTLGLALRVNADGSPDGSFRGSGSLLEQYAISASYSSFEDVALLPDGRIALAGAARQGGSPGALSLAVRLQANGAYDAFGNGGKAYRAASAGENFPPNAPVPGGYGVAIDGAHTYVGGSFDANAISRLSIAALDGNGNPDAAFAGGEVQNGVPGSNSTALRASGVALSSDGVYLAGTATSPSGTTTYGVVARYGAYPYTGPSLPDEQGKEIPPGDGGETKVGPRISGMKLSTRTLKKKTKAKLTFNLADAGTVKYYVEKATGGRKQTTGKGKTAKTTCVKETKKNRKAKRCTRYAPLPGSKSVKGKKGKNTITITRTVIKKALARGDYRLQIQATDAQGRKGNKLTMQFKVRP